MKIFKIFIICFIASCGNNQNSNQHDSEWIKQLERQKQIQENSKGWLDSGNREFSLVKAIT